MTTTRIDLPNDQWADFRPVDEVTERARRTVGRMSQKMASSSPDFVKLITEAAGDPDKIDKAAAAAALTTEGYDASESLNDATIVALTVAWSFPAEISLDGVLDLPAPAYAALRAKAAEYGKGLFLGAAEPTPDQESPTGP